MRSYASSIGPITNLERNEPTVDDMGGMKSRTTSDAPVLTDIVLVLCPDSIKRRNNQAGQKDLFGLMTHTGAYHESGLNIKRNDDYEPDCHRSCHSRLDG